MTVSQPFSTGFISANFVARVDDYDRESIEEWGQLDEKTRREYDPTEAADWMGDVADIGFDGVSLWTAHCWYHTADETDVAAVREAAAERDLEIYSYAGGFGRPPEDDDPDPRRDWERTYETAAALGCDCLAGGCNPGDREYIAEFGDEYDVGFAYENHAEESAEEIREQISGYEDAMGIAFDTGWAGTQGFDAAEAIRELGDHLLEVHLKDVEAVGGHETCAFGEGVVDIERCVRALEDVGFEGWVSIEHEPFDRDPMPEVRTSFERLQEYQS